MAQENGQGSIKFDTIGSFTAPLVVTGIYADGKATGRTVTLKDGSEKTMFKFTSSTYQFAGGLGGLDVKTSKLTVTTLTSGVELFVYFK